MVQYLLLNSIAIFGHWNGADWNFKMPHCSTNKYTDNLYIVQTIWDILHKVNSKKHNYITYADRTADNAAHILRYIMIQAS